MSHLQIIAALEELAERKRLMAEAAAALQVDDVEVLDTYRGAYTTKHPLTLLAWALEKMADADAVIFSPDWRDDRGCRVEHLASAEYEIPIIYGKGVTRMEWTVFTALAAIVGLGVTVGAPIIKLNANITRLTVVLDTIKAELEEQKKALSAQREDSKESHRRIWAHNDEQDQTLADHETRLRVLESKER